MWKRNEKQLWRNGMQLKRFWSRWLKKSFAIQVIDRNGFNINGFTRNKGIIDDEDKFQQANSVYPWITYYTNKKKTFEILKERIELEPNTCPYAFVQSKTIVELALFLRRGESFSSVAKQLRKQKKIGFLAVKINPKIVLYLGKNSRYDGDVSDSTVQKNGKDDGLCERQTYKNLHHKFISVGVCQLFLFVQSPATIKSPSECKFVITREDFNIKVRNKFLLPASLVFKPNYRGCKLIGILFLLYVHSSDHAF